ncbi:MAG: acetyl-CoA carboxylase biotin carboxyl carrier protein [Planctomycetes bacterium]|nr:acetyl-CoA carboxylase biotin carboxyl carrier protein [Planctomycetota bacterium]
MAPAAHDAEIARLKELLALMRDHALSELEIGPDGHSVRLSKNGPAPLGMAMAPMAAQSAPAMAGAAAAAPAAAPAAAAAPAKPAAPAGEKFLSPMVGTFYRASSPEAKPFVMEGDSVKVDAVLCIIEAMKVMNEIKAEKAGKVVQILVENGEAVEFGQPLFVIQAS